MDRIANYNIAFTGLKNGVHDFVFDVDQGFFDLFSTENEFTNANIVAKVLLDKHSSFMKLDLEISGSVVLVCDISGIGYTQLVTGDEGVVVKFGDKYDDSDGEIITIPHNHSEFNIAKLIFETVVISIPMKRVSPDLSDEYFEILDNFRPKNHEIYFDRLEENDEENIDPRWSELKRIKS